MTIATKTGMAILALCAAGPALGQAPPPVGISPVALAEQPYVFDTAEQHGIKVTVLAKGFPRPFALEALPDGDLLVAVRGGGLRIIRRALTADAALDPEPIPGMPLPDPAGPNVGLHDLALHPDFANNHWLYFTFNDPVPNDAGVDGPPQNSRLLLMRGKLMDGRLSAVETLFTGDVSRASGSRVHLAQDGTVWVTSGAPFGALAQDMASIYGKVLRLNGDGSFPADNPFTGQEGVHPAIYSYGHRDQHGLTVDPATGAVLSAEHGPNGGDEVNLIRAGGNYGWPDYTFGRNYDGTVLSELPLAKGIEKPLLVWLPSIAPSGLMLYQGDAFPAWKGNLFIGSARRGEVNHTGGLERVVFGANFGELRRETLLTQLHMRVRDMAEGPDGNIYVLTDGTENAVLRVEPSGL